MMLRIIVYSIFLVCVAIAAGSIALSSRLRRNYAEVVFSSLLYYQSFVFTFGFYGIWGQVVISTFLPGYISPDILSRFSDIAMLLGLPFLVFSWLMLIRFSNDTSGRKNKKWHIAIFLLVNFGIIIGVGYFITRAGSQSSPLIRFYYIAMNFLITLLAAALIRFRGKGRAVLNDYDRRIISLGIFLIMIMQSVPLIFSNDNLILTFVFIFTFFAGHAFLPLYISYGSFLRVSDDNKIKDLSFEDFCKKYEISPRESEIIIEICNGLSNQEISEKLFISLQTVKDHTHRIYTKTNVRSRVQLINLIRGLSVER